MGHPQFVRALADLQAAECRVTSPTEINAFTHATYCGWVGQGEIKQNWRSMQAINH